MSSNGKEWEEMADFSKKYGKLSFKEAFGERIKASFANDPFTNQFLIEFYNQTHEKQNPPTDQRYGTIHGYDPQL